MEVPVVATRQMLKLRHGLTLLPLVALLLAATPAAPGRAAAKPSPVLPGDKKEGPATVPANAIGLPVIAPTPRHFPNATSADVLHTFRLLPDVALGVQLICRWSHAERASVARIITTLARTHGVDTTTVLALSPLTLDQGRKELDLPKALRGKKPSFADKDVRANFIDAAKELAQLEPPYLCLGTEVNFLGLQRRGEYLHFVKLYKEAYHAVKKISPKTKVFVSFQYEFVRIHDNKEPGKVKEHAKMMIDVFRPEIDVVAITSYPASFYDSPADMPGNYYSYFRNYLKPGDEVMVMEIGWPSGGNSTEKKQEQFVRRLPVLLAELRPTVTIWALLHDVKVPEFDDNLATTGLRTRAGKEKPAYNAWKAITKAARASKKPRD
jgi:hypothetical protein